jgi:hypothetical protein
MAARSGADALIVSNHGGRQLQRSWMRLTSSQFRAGSNCSAVQDDSERMSPTPWAWPSTRRMPRWRRARAPTPSSCRTTAGASSTARCPRYVVPVQGRVELLGGPGRQRAHVADALGVADDVAEGHHQGHPRRGGCRDGGALGRRRPHRVEPRRAPARRRYRKARPMKTPWAPSARALMTSWPERMPPSISTSTRAPTPSSCRTTAGASSTARCPRSPPCRASPRRSDVEALGHPRLAAGPEAVQEGAADEDAVGAERQGTRVTSDILVDKPGMLRNV